MEMRLLVHVRGAVFLCVLFVTAVSAGASQARSDLKEASPEDATTHLTNAVPPVYPPIAKAAKIEGSVKMRFVIEEDGSVRDIHIISGHPMLVQAAIDALKQRRYRPFATAVVTSTEIPFSLGLSDADRSSEQWFQNTYWPALRRAEAEYKKGDLQASRHDYQVASEAAQGRPDKWGEYDDAQMGLAGIAFREKRYADAEQIYLSSLRAREGHQNPREGEIGQRCFSLGLVYFQEGKFGEARAYLERSASILDERRNDEENKKYIPEAVRSYARDAALSHFGLARLSYDSHDFATAEKQCSAAKDAVKQADSAEDVAIILEVCGGFSAPHQ